MSMRHVTLTLAACALLAAVPLHAAAVQSPQSLRQAAETWLRTQLGRSGNRVEVHADPLDSRLRLPACPAHLQISMPAGTRITSRIGVEVHCPVASGWRIRIPVRVHLYRSVLVTTRPLQRGDGIRPGDVRTEQRDVTRLGYGYIAQVNQVSGRTLSRPVSAGSVLIPGDLATRIAVRSGDQVQLIANLGGVQVRASGVALGSGDVGARLLARNDSSGRTVTAVVQSPGVLAVLP
ncbi:flagellar basal body P-ring formation chaperone FlgA [Dyella sp. A6]|uniref:flagellar basal body P-ring formation chaperone FlgA n=1 Tax=Dyella aluminiiresistens TaxID=3069105 RepID=UPI002E7A5D91|nr:flagellar basal body P-ring formation chaperone FlgA [Dyella sp. A6]